MVLTPTRDQAQQCEDAQHVNAAGIKRNAMGIHADEVLREAAEILHTCVGNVRSLDWCVDTVQKSFEWRVYGGSGRAVRCQELPTVTASAHCH